MSDNFNVSSVKKESQFLFGNKLKNYEKNYCWPTMIGTVISKY